VSEVPLLFRTSFLRAGPQTLQVFPRFTGLWAPRIIRYFFLVQGCCPRPPPAYITVTPELLRPACLHSPPSSYFLSFLLHPHSPHSSSYPPPFPPFPAPSIPPPSPSPHSLIFPSLSFPSLFPPPLPSLPHSHSSHPLILKIIKPTTHPHAPFHLRFQPRITL